MKLTEVIKSILSVMLLIMAALNFPLASEEDFDKEMAKALVMDNYSQVMDFVEDLKLTEDEKRLKVPKYITSKEDFIKLLSVSIKPSLAEDMYEDWIIEDDGVLYADSSYYIPTIHDESRIIEEAYIETKQPIFNRYFYNKKKDIKKELVIRERQATYDTSYFKRTYHYEIVEGGELMLSSITGTTSLGFADPKDNPWYGLWVESEN